VIKAAAYTRCFFYFQGDDYMALLKYCNKTGCRELVPLGIKYCPAHTLTKTQDNKERHREYDRHCRNKEAKAFYNSDAWKKTRQRVLARDNNIDVFLYVTEGRAVPAVTVHHIEELSVCPSRRLDMDNLISLSEASHNMISVAYKDKAGKENTQEMLKKCLETYKKWIAWEGV